MFTKEKQVMKKTIYALLLLIILVNLVLGEGEIRKIDIEGVDVMTVDLREGSGVEFSAADGRHIIVTEKIHKDVVDLDVFLFVDGNQKVSYITVSPKRTLKLDLDQDGTGDLYVGFNKVLDSNSARITLFKPTSDITLPRNKEEQDVLTSGITGSPPEENSYVHWLFLSITIVLLLLIVYFKGKENIKSRE